jgi:hypothetical protein
MKKRVCFFIVLTCALDSPAASTINSANKFAYGANLGWMDWRGDTNSGVVIGEYVCSGYIYAANVGWVNLGSGVPANGVRYQNNSPTDFGVNSDAAGNLRGYAYGANIGWVNFENTGAPQVDLKTGRLFGYIYGANVGWISLSNAVAFVQTDAVAPGLDSDQNGLPDAWEQLYFGHIGVDPNADPDGDGMSNLQEYRAGTNPNDPGDRLIITSISAANYGAQVTLIWKSVPTRCYNIQERMSLNAGFAWEDSGLGLIAGNPAGSNTTATLSQPVASQHFYRVQAVRPLGP